MLGMYLRSKIALVLAILGLVVLGLGIGQRTVWLPPATVTAGVEGTVAPAPLTVIGPDVLAAKGGQFTLTIKSAGPIQVAVGQQRDVMGWVGDAAYTNVTGVNGDFSALTTESKQGAQKVPNPAGSDMWVSEDKASGELSYTWQAPGHGTWALLVSSDGTAPAPTNITMTTANDTSTPWAVPLMILGSIMLALAALLFWMSPRKPRSAAVAAVPGRRAAGRAPTDPATGAVEVEKLVAARQQAAKAAAAAGAGAKTIAEINRANPRPVEGAGGTSDDGAAAPGEGPAVPDATVALPKTVFEPLAANDADGGAAGDSTGASAADATDSSTSDATGEATGKEAGKKAGKGRDGNDDNFGDGTGKPGGKPGVAADGGKPGGAADGGKSGGGAKGDNGGKSGGKSGFTALRSAKARWGAALAAVLVAGSIGPAVAADQTTPAPTGAATASTSPTVSGSPTTSPAATPGLPVLLDSQVQRIAADLATVVSSGDSAKNAKELVSRVAGTALQVREANYKIRSKVSSQAALDAVSSTKLLAKVVSTADSWPRSAMLVTQGDTNKLPQLLTLVQASAREQYKLVQATPLLPGQTFPEVDKEGAAPVPAADAAGLLMSPKDAIAALTDRLTKTDSKWKASFKDSVYISSVDSYQKKALADAKDSTVVFTHTPDPKATIAFRTADGGAMVVVSSTFGIDYTTKSDATNNLTDKSVIALAGGSESKKGFVVSYAEPVVMYIPPAGAGTQIDIFSANNFLVSAKIK